MVQDDLIITTNRIKSKVYIYGNNNLNQQYFQKKWLQKTKDFSQDEQMAKLKNSATIQAKTNLPKSNQLKVLEKVKKKKENKKKLY